MNWDLLRSLFTDDAELDYRSVGGPAGGREEVCGWLPGATETSACGGCYHHVMVRTESGWRSELQEKAE